MDLDGIAITIVRSKRKSLTLEVGAEGVKARAPMRMPHKQIEQFVYSKSNWIRKHFLNRPLKAAPLQVRDQMQIPYLGALLSLTIQQGKRGEGELTDQGLVLPVSQSHLPFEQSAKNKLIKFYKSAALSRLNERIHYYAQQMEIPMSKQRFAEKGGVKVRDYKRRWGSCDHLGRLSFNWRIIKAPQEVLDYVVIHELAHCHEFNHSPRFWQIVEQQMPNWKEQQRWLHRNGAQLYRI